MVLDSKFYIESIASDVRKRIVEIGIIEKDARSLSIEQVKRIIEFFGGNLVLLEEDLDEPTPYIIKTGEDAYDIYYKQSNNFLHILHELGHAFLILDNEEMKIGEPYYAVGGEKADFEAALFARALAMPRECFEEVVIRYWCDGKCNIHEVAKEYNVEYLEVLARGEELNIWE